jgi:peptide/nickel transport system substrate-binding protein
MKSTHTVATAAVLTLAAGLLSACGGGGSSPGAADAAVVDGGTFTMALSQDPGSLDPQMSATAVVFTASTFAYDKLISIDDKGEFGPELASEWSQDGQTISMTLKDGVTCSDGTPFTASTAADNINFIGDPANQSPLAQFVPPGITATADDAAGTLTVSLPSPAPFALNGLAYAPMVCEAGLKDRSTLKDGSSGTGPFVLDEVVPGDHLTYKLRDGYTWGPNGATTAEKGMPDEVVLKIVPDMSTTANLLLSGGLNAGIVTGPDADRLEGSGLFNEELPALVGEQFYNQAAGRPTADPAVRMALTQALDLDQLRDVITSKQGTDATSLTVNAPAACPGDSVTGHRPEHDPQAAADALDQAGWTLGSDGVRAKDGQELQLSLLYSTAVNGTANAAAAELAAQQWKDVGVEVKLDGQGGTNAATTALSGGDWDIAWLPIALSDPSQLVPYVGGPAVPDGVNFASIDNADYKATMAEAMGQTGADSCPTWLDAESKLIEAADVVPFANSTQRMFGKGARFDLPGVMAPTSIRMTAE